MEVPTAWKVVWCMVWWVMLPWVIHSDPIAIDFSQCVDAIYKFHFSGNVTLPPMPCCPLLPTRPIIDGVPPPTTDTPRVRMAAQCTDATYAETIDKAYALMRALPDDDPRSFKRQWELHCAYCGGSFLSYNSTGAANGIDIHFSWLFLPWHRYYLYFHERILQSLLGDPTFSLNYWNWDNPFSAGDGTSKDGVCLSKGDNFPAFFNDPSKATYDVNRSRNAMGLGRRDFADFAIIATLTDNEQPLANASAGEVIETNMNVMYNTMVSGGTTAETFMGIPYRAGDIKRASPTNTITQSNIYFPTVAFTAWRWYNLDYSVRRLLTQSELTDTSGPTGGSGTLENNPHRSIHLWIGTDRPLRIDMGALYSASRDPVFFSHHGNMDRMWKVWNDIGPFLGQDHSDYTDPDFLDASFLFYDENQDLRRVKIRDCLDTTKLGYVYQQAPISQWLTVNQTICSILNYTELIAAADTLPEPVKDPSGLYELASGAIFTIEVLRPNNTKGLEEFLIINGITLDISFDGGFDVFVDLLDPRSLDNPWKCPEYAGRFMNMANSRPSPAQKTLVWKQSITRTFVDIFAPDGPSTAVISLVSMSKAGSNNPTIYFTQVSISLGT